MKKLLSYVLILVLLFSLVSCDFSDLTGGNTNNNTNYDDTTTIADLNKIFADLFKDVDVDHVTTDLDFKNLVDGVKITYESRNTDVISNIGKVIRQDTDVKVDVKVTLKDSNNSLSDIVTFTVLKKESSPVVTDNILKAATDNLLASFGNMTARYISICEDVSYDTTYETFNNQVHYHDFEEYPTGEQFDDDIYLEYNEQGEAIRGQVTSEITPSNNTNDVEEVVKYLNTYLVFYLSDFEFGLDVDNYTQNGLVFTLTKNIDTAAKAYLCDYSYEDSMTIYQCTYQSLEITVSDINGKYYVTKITVSYDYGEENELVRYDEEITFSNFGTTSFEWKEFVEYKSDYSDLSELYSLSSGASVSNITAIVAATSGNTVYLTDNYYGIVLYLAKNSQYIGELNVGDVISVGGTIDIYNNLYEIKLDDSTLQLLGQVTVQNLDVDDLSTITTSCMGMVVNLKGVTLSTFEASSSKDTTITLTDQQGNTFSLFVKKNVAEDFNQLIADLEGYSDDSLFDIYNLGIQVYKSNLQVVLTDTTSFDLSEKYLVNISHFYTEPHQELSEVLKELQITDKETSQVYTFADMDYSTDYDSENLGIYYFNFLVNNEPVVKIIIDVVEERTTTNDQYTTLPQFLKQTDYYQTGLPNEGDVNILVIPIKFTNSKNYDLTRIEKGFNGTNEETGWYSLAGYYREASYGKLNIHAEVLDPYNTGEAYDLTSGQTGVEDYKYFHDAIAYYDNEIDYSLYDQNNDGYIDCVYLVYLAPYDGNTDLWWAYCYNYYVDSEEEDPKFDGVGLDYYLWFSYEFFDEKISSNLTVDINMETAIHESGHALGLDDYYDYDDTVGPDGGSGGTFMMDYNQGDHDPASKYLLGWASPTYTYNTDVDTTLRSFTDYGDVLVVSKNGSASALDEFYIIALYTPTKENSLKANEEVGLFSIEGVMIYHVDFTLKDRLGLEEDCFTIFKYDNSYTDHKKLEFIQREGDEILTQSYYVTTDKDLFQAGDTYNFTWYDGTTSGTLTINSLENSQINLQVRF